MVHGTPKSYTSSICYINTPIQGDIFYSKVLFHRPHTYRCIGIWLYWDVICESHALYILLLFLLNMYGYSFMQLCIHSEVLTEMLFPLGSSKRSIVLIPMIIVIPKVKTATRMIEQKIPDQIGMEKKPTQSLGRPNFFISLAEYWVCKPSNTSDAPSMSLLFLWPKPPGILQL